jgi:hypothetical protein
MRQREEVAAAMSKRMHEEKAKHERMVSLCFISDVI